MDRGLLREILDGDRRYLVSSIIDERNGRRDKVEMISE
jgi:hypothetical protein